MAAWLGSGVAAGASARGALRPCSCRNAPPPNPSSASSASQDRPAIRRARIGVLACAAKVSSARRRGQTLRARDAMRVPAGFAAAANASIVCACKSALRSRRSPLRLPARAAAAASASSSEHERTSAAESAIADDAEATGDSAAGARTDAGARGEEVARRAGRWSARRSMASCSEGARSDHLRRAARRAIVTACSAAARTARRPISICCCSTRTACRCSRTRRKIAFRRWACRPRSAPRPAARIGCRPSCTRAAVAFAARVLDA